MKTNFSADDSQSSRYFRFSPQGPKLLFGLLGRKLMEVVVHRVLRVVSVLVCVGLLLAGCGAREGEDRYPDPGAGPRAWTKQSPFALPSDGVVGSPRVVNTAGVPDKKVAAYVEAAREFYRAVLAGDCDALWARVIPEIRKTHTRKLLCGWETRSLARFDITRGELDFGDGPNVPLTFREWLPGGFLARGFVNFEEVNGKILARAVGTSSLSEGE